MNFKRMLAGVLSATLILGTLSGCSNDAVDSKNLVEDLINSQDNTSVSSTPVESKQEESKQEESKPEESSKPEEETLDEVETMAHDFVKALQTKDYAKLREFLPYEDTTFISDNDLDFIFLRSTYADIYGKGDSPLHKKYTDAEGYEKKEIKFVSDSGKIAFVNLTLGTDNKWTIDIDKENLLENYKLVLPFGTTPSTINGIQLTDKYLAKDDTAVHAEYTLPVLVNKPAEITVDFGETFGTRTVKINLDGHLPYFPYELTAEQSSQVCLAIQNRLNDLFAAYLAHRNEGAVFDSADWCSSIAPQTFVAKIEKQLEDMADDGYFFHVKDTIEVKSLLPSGTEAVEPFNLYTRTRDGQMVYCVYMNIHRHTDMKHSITVGDDKDLTARCFLFSVEDGKLMVYDSEEGKIINCF